MREDVPARALVSVREAHVRTGVPKRTLYAWVKSERIRSWSIGGTIFLHENDVRNMEKAREKAS